MNGDAYLQVQHACGSASKWPASIGLTDKAARGLCTRMPRPGVINRSIRSARFIARACTIRRCDWPASHRLATASAWRVPTAKRPPLRCRRSHAGTNAATGARRMQVPPTAAQGSFRLAFAPLPPRQVPGTATSLAHSRLCQSVLLVHRMLAQETTGTLCNARCITTFRRPPSLA